MSETIYTEQQVKVWLKGLLTVAWADGHYDEQEQTAISDIINELAFKDSEKQVLTEPISSQELLEAFGNDPKIGERFY